WYFISTVVIWPGGRSLNFARGTQLDFASLLAGPTAVTAAIPPSAMATPAPSTITPACRRKVARSTLVAATPASPSERQTKMSVPPGGDAGVAATGLADCLSETR